MSNAEVYQEVENWTPDERQKLARHLRIIELINDPAYMGELTQCIDEMKAGHYVTRDELLAHLAKRGIRLP